MKKILIVEDEQAYVHLLRDKLVQHYEVLNAPDGEEGLQLALKQHPDLILLDIRMPKMDGLTVLKKLRKDKHGKAAKVILLTNLEASDKIIMRVTRDLPTYYFVKSNVELDYILEKIDNLLQDQESEKMTSVQTGTGR